MPGVLLITGPSGSGKTTLAARIGQHGRWTTIHEDDIWNEIGHDPMVPRTDAKQDRVHAIVFDRVGEFVNSGRSVVVEFLVYERPPRRLLDYRDAFAAVGFDVHVRCLRPSEDAILERQRMRGRPIEVSDQVKHQLACVGDDVVESEWVVDTSDETLDETYDRHFAKIVESD